MHLKQTEMQNKWRRSTAAYKSVISDRDEKRTDQRKAGELDGHLQNLLSIFPWL